MKRVWRGKLCGERASSAASAQSSPPRPLLPAPAAGGLPPVGLYSHPHHARRPDPVRGVDMPGHGMMGRSPICVPTVCAFRTRPGCRHEYIAGAGWRGVYLPLSAHGRPRATAAQDAHEAIRSSVPSRPRRGGDISGDTAKAVPYDLESVLWQARWQTASRINTVSSPSARRITTSRASGYTVTFDGFTALYEEATDEKEKAGTNLPRCWSRDRCSSCGAEERAVHPSRPPATLKLPSSRRWKKTASDALYPRAHHHYHHRPRLCGARPESLAHSAVMGWTGLMLEQFPHIVIVDFSAQMEKNLDKWWKVASDWRDRG